METKTFTPIILDLGKKSSSKINKLKRGEGELIEEIEFTYNNIKEKLGQEDKEIIPVIVLYQEKKKGKRSFPFPFPVPTI